MAAGQSMTVADVVAKVRDGRLEDLVREAVALVARELMEAEIVRHEVGAELGEVAPGGAVDASQRLPASGVGDQRRRARAAGGEEAPGAGVPSELPGAQAALRAGDRRGRARGLCQRHLDPQGRPSRGAARRRGNDQRPRQRFVPGARRAGQRVPTTSARRRLPYLWVDAKWSQRRSWSPKPGTSPATAQ